MNHHDGTLEAKSDDTMGPRWAIVLPAATMVVVAVPFFAVQFPPATDLPQHLAQLGFHIANIIRSH